MTQKILQIEGLEASDLLHRLDTMQSAITALTNQPTSTAPETQTGYLTRREVSQMFNICLVTLNDWTRKGILQGYKIGNRVYYKRTEVEASLVRKGGKLCR